MTADISCHFMLKSENYKTTVAICWIDATHCDWAEESAVSVCLLDDQLKSRKERKCFSVKFQSCQSSNSFRNGSEI